MRPTLDVVKARHQAPVGAGSPDMAWELINIFRYTNEGHLVEGWVQTDTYDFLRQLSAFGS